MLIAKILCVAAVAVASVLPSRDQGSSLSTRASNVNLPTGFKWNSTGPLIGPKDDGEQVIALKDPSIVDIDGTYHVFATVVKEKSLSLVYLNFTDFSKADAADYHYLAQTPIGNGSYAAPEVFFFEPQKLWYLVFQTGDNVAYSTNADIGNFAAWTAPKTFFDSTPQIITDNKGQGGWVDMWVICDTATCYLFSSDDNGHLYRASTKITDFPQGMGNMVIALSDENKNNLFEASNVYKTDENQYLLIVEAIGSDSNRYFRSWTSDNLAGNWTGLADSEDHPFARSNNVAFEGTPWTKSISHGEAVRHNTDQTLSIDLANLQYFYQGLDPAATGDYNSLPWKLALLNQTT